MLDRELMEAALPGYELRGELGRGSWGIVIEAVHRSLNRVVAIKQLPRAFAVDEATQARFASEAQVIAQLDHPHIVRVYDFVVREGMGLIVMEYLPGGSLWEQFSGSGLDTHQSCATSICIASALHTAHLQGIVHRDVKPENVLLGNDGSPRLSDFGVAKLTDAPSNLTVVGSILGTPTYMAPEQATAGELGPACDIYALGTMLYELLSGRAPFGDIDTPSAMLYAHVHSPVPPLAAVAPTVPVPITDVVMRALEKDPAARQASAEEFGVDLAEAAARSLGRDWLRESGVTLREHGPIADAARRGDLATGPALAHVKHEVAQSRFTLDAPSGDEGYQLGIDMGTTRTAAAVRRGATAYVLHLGTRTAATPSAVSIAEDGTEYVGDSAERRRGTDPTSVATEFKRLFGDPTPVRVGPTTRTPVELTASLLRWIIEQSHSREHEEARHVTVCHPANWPAFKKDLLIRTVEGATDIPVSLVTEPEAAAVYYASQERVAAGAVLAVYDLGGGTFDSAVLRKTDTGFEILGEPEGIERLGGMDFDAAVFHHVARQLDGAPFELDPTDHANAMALAFLRRECVEAKEALTTDREARISVMLPNVHRDILITRSEFEQLIRPTLQNTLSALRRSLASANVTGDDVTSIVLVGGGSRIPLVSELLAESLGIPLAVDLHPKHAVALGAALEEPGDTRPELVDPAGAAEGTAETVPFSMPSSEPARTIAPTTQDPARTIAPTTQDPARSAERPRAGESQLPPPGPPALPPGSLETPRPAAAPDQAPKSRRGRRLLWGLGVLALAVVGIVVVAVSRAEEPELPLIVRLTGGTVEDGAIRVLYTTTNFRPVIDPDDPDSHHLHFFWNVFPDDTVSDDVPEADRNPFVIWDVDDNGEQVFDAFTVADAPTGTTGVCAVVATADNVVDEFGRLGGGCISLPTG